MILGMNTVRVRVVTGLIRETFDNDPAVSLCNIGSKFLIAPNASMFLITSALDPQVFGSSWHELLFERACHESAYYANLCSFALLLNYFTTSLTMLFFQKTG